MSRYLNAMKQIADALESAVECLLEDDAWEDAMQRAEALKKVEEEIAAFEKKEVDVQIGPKDSDEWKELLDKIRKIPEEPIKNPYDSIPPYNPNQPSKIGWPRYPDRYWVGDPPDYFRDLVFAH